MRYLEESYNQFLELKDETKIIGSMNNLGNLHSEIQLYEKAMKYFSQAYQLSEKQGVPFADPLNNIGNIYFRQNNYQRAVEYYEKALTIERRNGNKLGILNVVTNLGITYAKAKQPAPATKNLTEALELCNSLQAYSFSPSIYKAMAENFSNEGRFKEAYETQLRVRRSAREDVWRRKQPQHSPDGDDCRLPGERERIRFAETGRRDQNTRAA